jgi:hypothetical protein
MDRVDDLGAVDALQVDRGDSQVAMPELALDDDQRHALVGEFDSVGMAELVRGMAPVDARRFGGSAQLLASCGGLSAPSGCPAIESSISAKSSPTRHPRCS